LLKPFNPITNTSYTAEEQVRLRADFAPVAEQFRRQQRIIGWCVFSMAGLFLLGMLVPEPYKAGWSALLAVAVLAGAGNLIVAWLRLVGLLVCPGCNGDLEKLGSYCPECGSAGLQPGGWFTSPHCPTCNRKMRRNKGRKYTIRACSHCGLCLDKQGL
jgi:hypothetical protein